MRIALIILLLFTPFFISPALACGPESNCNVDGNRYYRIRMPANHDGKSSIGAIIFAHSYKATAVGTIRHEELRQLVSDLGVALVAVKSDGPNWRIPNSPGSNGVRGNPELSYFDDVIDDIGRRFPIDTSRLMMAGVSVGGMMTWSLACSSSDKFAGFAPMAGTFWSPPPKSCRSPPTNVIHFHGTADQTVPLKGRQVGSSRQGDVFEVLAMYTRSGGYEGLETSKRLDLECQRSTNANGKILEFCLHSGGHVFRAKYVAHAWKELERLGAFD